MQTIAQKLLTRLMKANEGAWTLRLTFDDASEVEIAVTEVFADGVAGRWVREDKSEPHDAVKAPVIYRFDALETLTILEEGDV